MGRLISAELRKILTTKLWWALMIPAFALALGWAWIFSGLTTAVVDEALRDDIIQDLDIRVDEISWSAIALTRGFNIASIFPMIFGALGVASELSRKTITTTFLTAPSRQAVLGAKAAVYALWGLLFGLVIAVGVSLGTLLGAEGGLLPDGQAWFLIILAGLIMCVLWTLVGLGVGALLGSPTAALVVLLVYTLVFGFIELLLMGVLEVEHLAGVFPNGAANGLTSSTASALLIDQIQTVVLDRTGTSLSDDRQDVFEEVIRAVAGGAGSFSLWVSGLIFLGWTALFIGTGMARNAKRDIT
ncbi:MULTISPECIES: ABC transporter permease subunit [Actinokineospora]|uniref:ABC transporter permease n=1 Tax=Actinokineospora fastidiosa TaxID=1816 RepID=A0A918LAT5_9PSEU|nr:MULTISPECIES: ABC transporter permease subunit [Actinokineospora]UVS81667.1 ABC-type transport system involved in multi-copper enzyme maturation, permease component [Actinokineospora sp. UTMC 2448]GGS26090.1 ABC transporter permease [Actinokineospora fastidiosa]